MVPDLSKWNFDKVNNLSFMFYGCEKIEIIPEQFKGMQYGVCN